MNPKHKTAGLFAAALGMIAIAAIVPAPPQATKPEAPAPSPLVGTTPDDGAPLVQVALLLDTSSSMDGLIDQARSELWRITRQLSEGKRDGKSPRIQLALYEYGNDQLPAAEGYVRQVVGFTEEIDLVSEALFALRTDGGSELVGLAIRNAVVALPWSDDDDALKLIFVAGNEQFAQGPVSPADAMRIARDKGIVVNPIYCGAMQAGVSEGWGEAAKLAQSHLLAIDHGERVAQIDAPQDAELARLNTAINDTYIPYGALGSSGSSRQAAQDQNSAGYGLANLGSRSSYKASAGYRNPSWELIDALDGGRVKLEALDEASLPPAMQALDASARRAYVAEKRAQRRSMKARILELTAERDAFVAKEREKLDAHDSLDVAMLSTVRDLASAKGLTFE